MMRSGAILRGLGIGAVLVLAAAAWGADDRAGSSDTSPSKAYDPLFLGWQTEPSMQNGGRNLASIQRGVSRLLGSSRVARRRPILGLAWEVPLALVLSIAHHEFDGHGARAREFGLGARYGAGFDLSAFTSIETPRSMEQALYISAAGTEASTVLASRLLRDLYRPGGGEGSAVPLLLLAKIDLSAYVFLTRAPTHDNAADFVDQYRGGNDVAIYLLARQAQRSGTDPAAFWDGEYVADLGDPLLGRNWNAARAAAIWNLLDPALARGMISWVRDHVLEGSVRVAPPMVRLGRGVEITAGTRAAFGPSCVTRALDLYLRTPFGVGQLYVRDLDSSIDKTYGYGLGFSGLRLGDRVRVGAQADSWEDPRSEEFGNSAARWAFSGELEVTLGGRFGLSVAAGRKSGGFLPGQPRGSGGWVGYGVLASF